VLYRFVTDIETVFILAIRRQRESTVDKGSQPRKEATDNALMPVLARGVYQVNQYRDAAYESCSIRAQRRRRVSDGTRSTMGPGQIQIKAIVTNPSTRHAQANGLDRASTNV